MVARAWEEGRNEELFSGCRVEFQFLQDGKVLEIGYTAV